MKHIIYAGGISAGGQAFKIEKKVTYNPWFKSIQIDFYDSFPNAGMNEATNK